MTNYNKYIENAEHHLNKPLPDRKKAIYFYLKAIEETKSIEKKTILSNIINGLKGEINLKEIINDIMNE